MSVIFDRRISESYDYDACLLVSSVSEPDPSSYANYLSSSSPSAAGARSKSEPANAWEAQIDELLAKQASETAQDSRRAAFNEIQRILAEQLPVIPVVARHIPVAANQRVGNYSPSASPALLALERGGIVRALNQTGHTDTEARRQGRRGRKDGFHAVPLSLRLLISVSLWQFSHCVASLVNPAIARASSTRVIAALGRKAEPSAVISPRSIASLT